VPEERLVRKGQPSELLDIQIRRRFTINSCFTRTLPSFVTRRWLVSFRKPLDLDLDDRRLFGRDFTRTLPPLMTEQGLVIQRQPSELLNVQIRRWIPIDPRFTGTLPGRVPGRRLVSFW
jgi:hypothetical protein